MPESSEPLIDPSPDPMATQPIRGKQSAAARRSPEPSTEPISAMTTHKARGPKSEKEPSETAPPSRPDPLPNVFQPAQHPCPNCGDELVDPTGLRLCSACGFCGSLAEGKASLDAVSDHPPEQLGFLGMIWHLRNLPAWIVGVGIVAGLILIGNGVILAYPVVRSPEIEYWIVGQAALGILLWFAAQAIAYRAVSESFGTTDPSWQVFPSLQLWVHAGRCLPTTRIAFATLTWSLVFLVSAFALVPRSHRFWPFG